MSIINESMHWLARKCGVDYRRYSKENWVCLRRAHILATRKIDLVVDVGANRGDYVLEIRGNGYRGAAISFEPLREAFVVLQQRAAEDSQWHCENLAIGDVDGEIDLNVSGRETSSSLLKLADAHLAASPESKAIECRQVRIRRLDQALSDISLATSAKNIWLKADVQGFEKEVLKGASETIGKTGGIEIELSLASVYEGGPLISEMMAYVMELGFTMVSFEPMFFDPITGFVLQGDGIFVRAG